MDDEDIIHWRNLINEYKRHLRLLEEKLAVYGKLECPPYILRGIEDTNKNIDRIEQNIRVRIKNSNDSGRLFTNEDIDTIYNKWVDIWYYEDKIAIEEKYLTRIKQSIGSEFMLKLPILNRVEARILIVILSVNMYWITRDYRDTIFGILLSILVVITIKQTFDINNKIKAAKNNIIEWRADIEKLEREIQQIRAGD